MLQTFLTQRTLKRKLGSPRALQGHSGTQGIGNLSPLGTGKTFERHLGTWVLVTQALGHLGTRDTRSTLFSRLFREPVRNQLCN